MNRRYAAPHLAHLGFPCAERQQQRAPCFVHRPRVGPSETYSIITTIIITTTPRTVITTISTILIIINLIITIVINIIIITTIIIIVGHHDTECFISLAS